MVYSENILEITDLSLHVPQIRGDTRVLVNKINYSLKKGERLALLGPNGSGKSTLLRAILGDKIFYNGNIDRSFLLNDVAYMPQDYRKALFPWLSIEKNIDLYNQKADDIYKTHFYEYLESVHLKIPKQSKVGSLSGGEQQLILLFILLSKKSKIMILDEPLSAVDIYRKKNIRTLLLKYFNLCDKSIILVTHDIEDAVHLSHKAIVFSGDPSSLSYIGNKNEKYYKDTLYEQFY